MDKQNRIIGLVGKKGSGKSTAFQRILTYEPRLVLFDAMAEHDWCPNKFSELDHLLDFLDSQYHVEEGRVDRYFAARYVPQADPRIEIENFSAEMFRYEAGPLSIKLLKISCPEDQLQGILYATMKEPANITATRTVVVRIEGNVPWQWRIGSGDTPSPLRTMPARTA